MAPVEPAIIKDKLPGLIILSMSLFDAKVVEDVEVDAGEDEAVVADIADDVEDVAAAIAEKVTSVLVNEKKKIDDLFDGTPRRSIHTISRKRKKKKREKKTPSHKL